MPSINRPDGAGLHWESRGDGPVVLLAHHTLWSHPAIYGGLLEDLARDHRVVVYDPRGCGASDRNGPFDPQTDADDLLAVVQAAGGSAAAIGIGDGFNRAVRAAFADPETVSEVFAVVPAAATVLPRSELQGSGVMAASEGVIEMILKLLETDPRAAMRTLITVANPELDEQQLRERVELVADYLSLDAATERARAWLEDDVSKETAALGERLWILHGSTEQLFEGALEARVVELFPKAHIEEIGGGAISRPELVAAAVRGVRRS